MTIHQKFLTAAGLLALSLSATAACAHDADVGDENEKCYGVAKASANDCASSDGAHSCAGAATSDLSDVDWVSVPKGLCDKLANGSLTPPTAAGDGASQ